MSCGGNSPGSSPLECGFNPSTKNSKLSLVQPLHPLKTLRRHFQGTVDPKLHDIVKFLQHDGPDDPVHAIHGGVRTPLSSSLFHELFNREGSLSGINYVVNYPEVHQFERSVLAASTNNFIGN